MDHIEGQKQPEVTLQESEERFRTTFDNMLEGCQIIGYDWRYLYINKSAASHGRRNREEMIGRTMMELFPGIEKTEMFATLVRSMNERTLHQMENRFIYPDGSVGWFKLRISPVPKGIFILSLDITESKLAENALRESEDKYRKFFEDDISGDYLATTDGEILDCNPAFVRILGFDSKQELIKQNVRFLFQAPNDWKAILKRVKSNIKIENQELELRKKDGGPAHVIQNITGIFDEKGDLRELRGYAFDVTPRKSLEEQLHQSQKLESIGVLAGGIAHDFNNLLTIILGYCHILLNTIKKRTPMYTMLEQIEKAGQRASSLTQQLLAFSRKQIIQPQILNLNAVIGDSVNMLHRIIGEDIELVTYLAEDLNYVKVDAGQMNQVVINLAVNARDAMPKGGKLTIETHNVFLDKNYADHHLSVTTGDYIMVAISDNGEGMDTETKSRIFEPFFTTKKKGKGTGLGLSTVYGIVRQSGGNIWVYSEPGQGTTFKIYFPKIQTTDMRKVQAPALSKSLTGSETILLVEDDNGVREMASTSLKNYGYQVLAADTGQNAIRLCKNHPEPIHLLITDVVMPGMGGKQLAKKVLELYPGAKVLFMSGYTDNAIVHHGVLDEGVNLVQKPFNPEGLAKKAREVLDAPDQ